MTDFICRHNVKYYTSVINRNKISLIDITQSLIGNKKNINETHTSLELNGLDDHTYTRKSSITRP